MANRLDLRAVVNEGEHQIDAGFSCGNEAGAIRQQTKPRGATGIKHEDSVTGLDAKLLGERLCGRRGAFGHGGQW